MLKLLTLALTLTCTLNLTLTLTLKPKYWCALTLTLKLTLTLTVTLGPHGLYVLLRGAETASLHASRVPHHQPGSCWGPRFPPLQTQASPRSLVAVLVPGPLPSSAWLPAPLSSHSSSQWKPGFTRGPMPSTRLSPPAAVKPAHHWRATRRNSGRSSDCPRIPLVTTGLCSESEMRSKARHGP